MYAKHNISCAIAIFVTATLLLNAMAPTLAYAATYLQGTEVNANTLVKDAYVQVTYYDDKGKQKLEKGWIYAISETTFEIRNRALFGKEIIAYDKVVSVIMSDESTTPIKQINEVDQFMREMKKREARALETEQAAIQKLNQKPVTVMVRGQIDTSQVPWNAYVHVVYTSHETATGRIVNKTASGIIMFQNKQRGEKIAYNTIDIAQKNIAYDTIDTLVVAKRMQDIERYRELGAKYDARVRFRAPSVSRKRITGRLINMTQDILIIEAGSTLHQVPVSAISNFEVSIGQYRNTGKGWKIGLVTGIGMAILINVPDSGGDLEGLAQALATAIIVPSIVVISTLGGAITKFDKWVEVPPDRLNLSIAPTSTKGLRAALMFNF